jgi:hypothetical protein
MADVRIQPTELRFDPQVESNQVIVTDKSTPYNRKESRFPRQRVGMKSGEFKERHVQSEDIQLTFFSDTSLVQKDTPITLMEPKENVLLFGSVVDAASSDFSFTASVELPPAILSPMLGNDAAVAEASKELVFRSESESESAHLNGSLVTCKRAAGRMAESVPYCKEKHNEKRPAKKLEKKTDKRSDTPKVEIDKQVEKNETEKDEVSLVKVDFKEEIKVIDKLAEIASITEGMVKEVERTEMIVEEVVGKQVIIKEKIDTVLVSENELGDSLNKVNVNSITEEVKEINQINAVGMNKNTVKSSTVNNTIVRSNASRLNQVNENIHVSAVAKLIPKPPALVDSKNAKIPFFLSLPFPGTLLNLSIASCLS